MIIHPQTSQALEAIIKHQPHALLITGVTGSGKGFVSKLIVEKLLNNKKLNSYPYFHEIEAKTEGSIETVRGLKEFLARKTTGSASIRRFLIINHAEHLGHEAQNAMLKLLEEPPEDTMIIITSSDTTQLLPTILSRVHELHIYPLSYSQARQKLQAKIDDPQFNSLYYLSGGQPGMLSRLVDQTEHPIKSSITKAKKLLQSSSYERLASIEGLLKQKEDIDELLIALERVLKMLFISAKEQDLAKRFHKARIRVNEARVALKQSVNTKLLLTQLFIEL